MSMTVVVPEDLEDELHPVREDLPQVLRAGLRYWRAGPGYSTVADVLEKLATLPTPEEVLAMKASPQLQERIGELLEKSKGEGLSSAEQREWDQFEYAEYLVCLAKARAAVLLQQR